jgi:hypothetical protein
MMPGFATMRRAFTPPVPSAARNVRHDYSRLERLQVLNQITLLLRRQAQAEKSVIVVDHVAKGGKAAIMIEAALLM